MRLTVLITLRSIQTRPARLLLSAFGIILGVAGILAIGITNQTAMNSITRLLADTSGKASLVVFSADSQKSNFTDAVLHRIQLVPGVEAAIPSLHVQTLLAKDASTDELGLSIFGASIGGLTLYGIDPLIDSRVRAYQIVQGRFLSTDEDAEEIVLVKEYADEKDLTLGNLVKIMSGHNVQSLRIVGLMARQGAGQINNGAFGVLPLKTAQRLFDLHGKINQVDILSPAMTDRIQNLDQVKTALQARLGKEYSVVYPASQGKSMTQMLANYQIGLNFLSGIALFVGAFLVYNAFLMTVVERTREFGLLRAVGMTSAQVTGQVLIEAALLGIFGSTAGLGLGVLTAGGLTRLMTNLLAQDLTGLEIPPGALISAMLVGLMVTLAAAAIPALQAGRITPLEALRVRANPGEHRLIRYGSWVGLILLAASTAILVINPFPQDVQYRLGNAAVFTLFLGATLLIPSVVSISERMVRPLLRLIYGSSGQLGSSNLQRARLRTTLTVAAMMIGMAMIIVVWAMTGSFKQDLDEWLRGYIGGDLYITSSLPLRENLWRRLEMEAGVMAVAPVRYFQAEWLPSDGEQQKVVVMAFEPASYSQVTSFVFSKEHAVDTRQAISQVAAGQAVFISSVLSEKYGLKPGDSLCLVTHSGEQGFKIAAVVVDYFNQGFVIDIGWSDMDRYFRQHDANALFLKVAPGYDVGTVKLQIEERYSKSEHLVIASNQSLLQRISLLTSQAFGMFDVLAIISLLVALFGIMNTMTMNIMERTREIGMLRSIGMTRSQVIQMILVEAGLMGTIGGAFGLFFGSILARLLMVAMSAMSGYSLIFSMPAARLVLAFLIAVVVAYLAALLPALRTVRLRLLDAIQYE